MFNKKSVLVLIILVGLIFATSLPGVADSKPIVGMTVYNTLEPFFVDMVDGIADAAKEMGFDAIIVSADGDANKQMSQIEDFIIQDVDAIIMTPVDSSALVPAVKAANEASIPVFTIDIGVDDGDVVNFTTSDNYMGGELLGEHLANNILGPEGGEVVLMGKREISSNYGRMMGFLDAIKRYPQIKLVQETAIGYARDEAMKVAEDLLVTYPNLDAIFGAFGGDTGIGATSAVKAAGRNDVAVLTFDAIDEARELLFNNDPVLVADCAQFPYNMGFVSVENVYKYLNGEEVPAETYLDVVLVTSESLVKVDDKILIKGYETD
jgi:ribose transport system substrate-binding protein